MADDDDQKVPHFATARPPPGEEDVYSASTVASEASDEMLAIIRGESQRAIPAAPGVPKNLKIDPKSEPKIALKPDAKSATATAADLMPTKPPPPAAGAPPPPAPAKPASKPAYTATPLEVPVTKLTPTSEPPRSVEIAPDPEPAPSKAKAEAEAKANAEADAKAEAEAKAEPTAVTRSALQKDDDRNFREGTMHPAVGIVLFFVAVFAVLAALIR